MKKTLFFLLCIIFQHGILSADFIPVTTIQGPKIPEAYNFQNIQGSFGEINKQTCDLNIVSSEVSLPGRGLLNLNISRSYSSKLREQQKSDTVINNYLDFIYDPLKVSYISWAVQSAFLLANGYANPNNYGDPGYNEWISQKLNEVFYNSPEKINKIKDDCRRTIHEGFDMSTVNHFLDSQQQNFGTGWDLNINGFSKIYVYELFLRDTSNQGQNNDENSKYYWQYKAFIKTTESGYLTFEKSYKTAANNDKNLPRSSQPPDGSWSVSGYESQNVKNEDVIKEETMRFNFNDSGNTITLISIGGLKYTFSKKQADIFQAEYNQSDDDHPTHQKVHKHIFYLTKIEDKYGNIVQVQYQAGTYKIDKIIDTLGQDIAFSYTNEKIKSISYPGDSGAQLSHQFHYTQTTGLLTEAINELNQNISYEYNPNNQITKIQNQFGLSVAYTYAAEKNWEVGFDPDNPSYPPEQPIVNLLLPDPNNIVITKNIYDNGILQTDLTEEYNRTAYFRYLDSDSDGRKDRFFFDTSVILTKLPGVPGSDKVFIYLYNDQGLLSSVQSPLGYINIFSYSRDGQYYIHPISEIVNKTEYSCPACTNISAVLSLSKKENFYTSAGLQDYSLTYKNGDDAQWYLKEKYAVSNAALGDYFFHLNKQQDVHNNSGTLLRSAKAEYNTYCDITSTKRLLDSTYITNSTISYDPAFPWLAIQTEDAEGIRTTFGYDTSHVFLTSSANNIYSESYEYYQPSGRLKKNTDKNGNVTELTYDVLGRLTENKSTGINIKTSIIYDDAEKKVKSSRYYDTTELIYGEKSFNSMGQMTEEKSIDRSTGQELKTAYSYLRGKLASKIVNPDGTDNEKLNTYYTYDLLDRQTLILNPDYSEVKTSRYYIPGLKLQVVNTEDSLHKKRTEYLDYMGRLTAVVLTNEISAQKKGYRTEYAYDEIGQMLQYKQNPSASSPLTGTKQYDSLGRLKTETDPDGVVASYTYFNNDKIHTITTPKGTETYFYDSIGRPQKTEYTSAPSLLYTYDSTADGNKGIGELTKVEKDGICSTEFKYGFYGRLLKETKNINSLSRSYSSEYTYDNFGNINQVTRPDGKILNFANDYSGKIQSITYNSKVLASYGYNVLGNGTSAELNCNTIRIDNKYFKSSHLTEISAYNKVKPSDQYLYFRYLYTFDRLDTREDINKNTEQYSYDATTGMLTKVYYSDDKSEISYTHDNFFNRTSLNAPLEQHDYVYQAGNNRLDHYTLNKKNNAKYQYSYDNTGNVGGVNYLYNSKVEQEKAYTWNQHDQLIGYNYTKHRQNPKIPNLTLSAQYDYDESGNLLKHSVDGKTNYYIYTSDGVLLGEADNAGNIKRSYIYGVNGKEAVIDNSGAAEKIYYYLRDQLGTSCRVLNESNKYALIQIIDAYGNLIHSKQSIIDNDRFTGKEYFPENDLIYFGARWYDENTGRFISKDPISKETSPFDLNRMIYCYNNPLSIIDPTGKDELNGSIGSDYSSYNYGMPSAPPPMFGTYTFGSFTHTQDSLNMWDKQYTSARNASLTILSFNGLPSAGLMAPAALELTGMGLSTAGNLAWQGISFAGMKTLQYGTAALYAGYRGYQYLNFQAYKIWSSPAGEAFWNDNYYLAGQTFAQKFTRLNFQMMAQTIQSVVIPSAKKGSLPKILEAPYWLYEQMQTPDYFMFNTDNKHE